MSDTPMTEHERDRMIRVILTNDCNMTAAAKELDIAKSTLYSRLKAADLSIDKLRKLKESVPDIIERVDAELAAERTTRCPECGEGLTGRQDSGTYRNADDRFNYHVYGCGSSLNRVGHHQQSNRCKKIAERAARRNRPAGAVA